MGPSLSAQITGNLICVAPDSGGIPLEPASRVDSASLFNRVVHCVLRHGSLRKPPPSFSKINSLFCPPKRGTAKEADETDFSPHSRLCSFALIPGNSQSVFPFMLQRTIALPGVTGKFDHFAIDLAGPFVCFAAATVNHSVEVIDLKSDKVEQSISGLGKPHGLAWVDATSSLYVADGSLCELRVYKGSPLKLAGTIKLSNDADDMVYRRCARRLYVGHGGGSAAVPGRVRGGGYNNLHSD